MKNEVTLSVGSTGESVYLLRTVVASIAARLQFSLDDIDDLSLAVSEAAAFLLAEAADGSRLSMRIAGQGSAMDTVLWIESRASEWPPRNVENGLAWKILSALTDRADFVREPAGPGIRLVKKSSSGGALQ